MPGTWNVFVMCDGERFSLKGGSAHNNVRHRNAIYYGAGEVEVGLGLVQVSTGLVRTCENCQPIRKGKMGFSSVTVWQSQLAAEPDGWMDIGCIKTVVSLPRKVSLPLSPVEGGCGATAIIGHN